MDLGEYLLGTVGVTPVFFESDGSFDTSTEDWTPQEITDTLAMVTEGVNWWSDMLDTLDTVHELDFVIDDTFAVDPVETPWEPIANTSDTFSRYVSRFMIDQGYSDSTLNRAVQLFNDAQRQKLGTDWAFTIFMIDASNDPDGFFKPGSSGFLGAFAFTYGSFLVTTTSRPASTIAHEMGHIFQTLDEYPGPADWTARSGYYSTQNLNAADNPTPGFQQEISIMRGGVPLQQAYDTFVSPATTLATVGWQDSDNDGIFDVLDVPLELSAVGYFDADNAQYIFNGSAAAGTLRNENPFTSNLRSDITLNRISELQYRLDDGDWQTASQPDLQRVDFELTIPVSDPFTTIELRAIDQTTGVTSEIIQGSPQIHAFDDNGIRGFAFVDENANGQRDADESLMVGAQVRLRNADGSERFGGRVRASDFADGEIPQQQNGVLIRADGNQLQQTVQSLVSDDAGERVFVAHNAFSATNNFIDRWDQSTVLRADFDQLVGNVEVTAIGLNQGSHVRIEGYDAQNNLITRHTSDLINAGETAIVALSDPLGRIDNVRIFGQGIPGLGEFSFGAAISELRFGATADPVITGSDGAFQFSNVPAGDYQIEWVSDKIFHQFNQATLPIQVTSSSSQILVAPAQRVDNPRHNSVLSVDVNRSGGVTPLDALLVINDLAANSTRVLGETEIIGDAIDVNDDGSATPLDILLVINYLAANDGQGGPQSEQTPNLARSVHPQTLAPNLDNDVVLADWSQNLEIANAKSARMAGMFNSAGQTARSKSNATIGTDNQNDSVMAGQQSGQSDDDVARKTFKPTHLNEKSNLEVENISASINTFE